MSTDARTLFSLAGRVALVTGAGGGLGHVMARILVDAGAAVVLCGRRLEPLQAVCQNLVDVGGRATAVSLDVTDPASVAAGFDAAEAAFGTVDLVVGNAGVARPEPAMTLSPGDWQQTIDVNLSGCWYVAQEAARRLQQAGQAGSIVFISSILGQRVAGALAAYAASKGALEQLTRTLALEWAREDIRVNAIAPGYIETDLNRDFFTSAPGQKMIQRIPQKRLGQAEELAGALLLLASNAGAYMTGATVVVDGGHLQSSL